jgi:hypothetical protein
MIIAEAAFAEAKKSEAKATIEKKVPETRYRKSVFSGNEARFAAMNYVNADCSSGAIPDVRIVTQPANGELRMEQIRYVVDRAADNSRAHCNGKEVDALGLFYKSRDGFVGEDRISVDVDYRNGRGSRYLYVITVR